MAQGHPIPDPLRRARAREYARLRRRLFLADLLLSAAILLLVVVSGLAVWWQETLAALLPPAVAGPGLAVVYVSSLVLGGAVLNLPLALYGGFVLPHRFHLSVQTLGAWS